MSNKEISFIYYPTTVVFIDDNKTVLENIELKLGKHIPCKTYSDPTEALNFLQKELQRTDLLKNIIGLDESANYYSHTSGQVPIQYDITKILQPLQSKDLFSEISVIVVDQAMPGLKGEELCSRLTRTKGSPVKIIMLTGEADEAKAVKLLNSRIIDAFLMKSQPDIHEDLKNTINDLQKLYFQEISYPLVKAISSDVDSSLSDPVFIDFFNDLVERISASSYFLIETSGSFFLLDSSGKPTWLLIRSLNELEQIANQMEEEIPEELIDSIRKGDLVPYFYNAESYYEDFEKLKKCLYKAKRLQGKKEYAYTILNEPPFGFPLKASNFLSFNDYLDSI